MRKALPHLATCGNLESGFLAMLFAASGDFVRAAAFVLEALAATNARMVSTVPFPSPAALFSRRKGVHEG